MSLTREKAQLMSASEIDRTLVRLAHEILEKTKDLDRLAFIGILEPGPGLLAIVERQAAWLGEVLARRLPVPGDEQMWRAIDGGGERRSHRQFCATGSHTLLCNRHAYLGALNSDLRRARRHRRHVRRVVGTLVGKDPHTRALSAPTRAR